MQSIGLSALLARTHIDIALESIAGQLRGPHCDGAATYGTDAAYAPPSEAPVVWTTWDVTTVSPTSGLRKPRLPENPGAKSQGPRQLEIEADKPLQTLTTVTYGLYAYTTLIYILNSRIVIYISYIL